MSYSQSEQNNPGNMDAINLTPADTTSTVSAENDSAPKTSAPFMSKKLTAALIAALVVLAAAIGSLYIWQRDANERAAYHALQAVLVKPSRASAQGGLPAEEADRFNTQAPTVDLYVDFSCPDCAELETILAPTLKSLQHKRQINIQIHPVDFLDSPENDHYSKRTASAAMYVSEHEPNALLDFTNALLDKDFQSAHAERKQLDDALIRQTAQKAGVSDTVAKQSTKGTYDEYVDKATKYTTSRRDLFVEVGKEHRFSSPTVAINGKLWPYRQLTDLHTVPDALITSLGLKKDQVGTTTLPSIGADGKALPIKH
jgi:protein-disulfide isomerase